jgi:hypothetical protein
MMPYGTGVLIAKRSLCPESTPAVSGVLVPAAPRLLGVLATETDDVDIEPAQVLTDHYPDVTASVPRRARTGRCNC